MLGVSLKRRAGYAVTRDIPRRLPPAFPLKRGNQTFSFAVVPRLLKIPLASISGAAGVSVEACPAHPHKDIPLAIP